MSALGRLAARPAYLCRPELVGPELRVSGRVHEPVQAGEPRQATRAREAAYQLTG
jgi:hypothetical protein